MTLSNTKISSLYSIGGDVVFYRKDLYKCVGLYAQSLRDGSMVGVDIFGNEMTPTLAEDCLLSMVDYPGNDTYAENVAVNIQIGAYLVALWREYVAQSGVPGQGLPQLQSFSTIGLGLLMGCLYEAAQLIPMMPEDEVITPVIKSRFAAACTSANRLP